jgi:hypothetical protein
MKAKQIANLMTLSVAIGCLFFGNAAAAKQGAAHRPAQSAGVVYPQCLYQGKTARWIPQQMPFNVWVSHGLSLDSIIDPATGAPVTNTANMQHWGDAVIDVVQNNKLGTLSVAEGFNEEQYQAAIQGINSWKGLEREGLFHFNITDNPEDADVYVFFTNHFVNKLGLGLFENDIRGYTSKWLLPAEAVVSALQRNDLELVRRSRKPVVVLLRTTKSNGVPMPFAWMKASAAHEMGHVLGIDGHSPYATDLMSLYYGNGVVSANDAATVRFLYKRPAQMIP